MWLVNRGLMFELLDYCYCSDCWIVSGIGMVVLPLCIISHLQLCGLFDLYFQADN